MALVGYARVSTLDQDHTAQLERLTAAGCTKVFSEKKSGTTQQGRAALDECLGWLREGDTLVFTKIDRLARSQRDLHNMVHDLEKRGVSIMALDQAIDTRTAAGKAFLGMLAVFAEFETNIRKERQLEGIAKAKTEGVYKGRKATAKAKRAEVEALLTQGMTKPKIAETLGISVASVYNVLKAA
ncbi:MAG: recombinase family protein [Candidatus Thiothrix sulfatifontis]|nr:MAG: recombinase family protein [Candidatus Thiothrix sulfatifontis]